jgi:hypothetical protein
MSNIRIQIGKRDLTKRLVTQNEYGVFYRNKVGQYYATTINQFDDATPQGFKRYTTGSHCSSFYANGSKQLPLDFRVGAGVVVKCNVDVKIYNGHTGNGNWCTIQPIKYPDYKFLLVHVHKWKIGRVIKAGDSICKIAPTSLNGGYPAHLHIAGRYKNKSYPMRKFILTNFNGHNMEKYIVQSGDTLKKIAQRFYGDESKYKEIFNANKPVVYNVHSKKNQDFTNPNVIYAGMRLQIPEIVDDSDRIASLKSQINELGKQIKKDREEYKQEIKEKENQITGLKHQLSTVLGELDDVKKDKKVIQKKYETIKNDEEKYVQRIEQLIKENNKYQVTIRQLKAEWKTAKEDLQKWRDGEFDELSIRGLLKLLGNGVVSLFRKLITR